MTGACIIDGIDIATLGAFILRDGDNDFISFPSRKEPEANDWPEEDGIEISKDTPVFSEKKLTVKYYLKGDETTFKNRLDNFYNIHCQPGYRSVYVREFDKTFQLRFLEVSDYSQKRGFTVSGQKSSYIDVLYSMDNPTQFLNSNELPVLSNIAITHIELNGIDLAEYGIIVESVYPSAMKLSSKEGLLKSSGYSSGIVADIGAPFKKNKQAVTIECTMIANSREDFMTNYNALWNNINGAVVTIGLTAANMEFDCYYSAMSNFSKRPWTSRAIANFNLDFTANVS